MDGWRKALQDRGKKEEGRGEVVERMEGRKGAGEYVVLTKAGRKVKRREGKKWGHLKKGRR